MKKEKDLDDIIKEKNAIENCENQVLNRLSYVQPFGYLLAARVGDFQILYASKNCSEWFGKSINTILNSKLDDLFSKDLVHNCSNAIGHSTIKEQREHLGTLKSFEKASEVFGHLKDDNFIIELQPVKNESSSSIRILDIVHRIIERLEKNISIQELVENAVDEFRYISGFSRVKAYKFLPDGSGEVIAEAKDVGVNSFLGLRFPAMDVPEAAKKLYSMTPIRIIPSVESEQVEIIQKVDTLPLLDLSLALFRGTVPVHTLYLKNMGVKATLSLPIVIDNKMWGLFAFHHMEERMLDSEILAALEILGGSVSMLISSILKQHYLTNIRTTTDVINSIFIPDDSPLGFSTYWKEAGEKLSRLISCDGLSLLSEDSLKTYGACLSEDVSKHLVKYLDKDYKDKKSESPIAIDSIKSKYPDLESGNIAGVLAIPHPAPSYSYIFIFRKEIKDKIRWAGNPTKEILRDNNTFRLNPRASFKEYLDKSSAQSDAFDDADINVAYAIYETLSSVFNSVSTQKENRQRLGLVIRELNHRARNTLALVSSIISQSRDANHSLEEYLILLENRIQSLSEAQKLLTENEWKPVKIIELFNRALNTFSDFNDRWTLKGANNIALPPNLVSLLTLVINELLSNALKHGALSNSVGNIKIEWFNTEKDLNIIWKEQGGPIVKPPTRVGFGTSLISEGLAYEFDAICKMNYFREGIEVSFKIPISQIKANTKSDDELLILKNEENVDSIKTFKALILEDDFMISKELKQKLKFIGAKEVDAVSSIEKALTLLMDNTYDIAFLDVNIRGEDSFKVAKKLNEIEIPFSFVTGYGSKSKNFENLKYLSIITKPVSKINLEEAIVLAKIV